MADCLRCGGACCESITLDIRAPNSDFQRFVELRTVPQMTADGTITRNFECKCTMLRAGRCLIYDSGRPQMCKDFIPGGPLCQATVKSRRSAEEVVAILGE